MEDKEYARKYRLEHKDKIKEYNKRYHLKYKDNPEHKKKRQEWARRTKKDLIKYKETRKIYNAEHPEYMIRNTKRERKTNRMMRFEAMELLGGKCVRCGFSDWRALQFDHINGGGVKDAKITHGSARIILRRLQSGDKRYQLLCANCNWIKRYENNETPNKFGREEI